MHYIIENFYSPDEVEDILTELKALKRYLDVPEKTGTAKNAIGIPKKSNTGLFLDDFFKQNRNKSVILSLNRKTFSEPIKNELKKFHWFFKYIDKTNIDTTLVSYYQKGDYYKDHEDMSIVTAIYYVWEEPKGFEGGDIIIDGETVNIKNNSMLFFPSKMKHKVTEITEGQGRWAITQFADMETPLNKVQKYKNFLEVTDFNKVSEIVFKSQNWTFSGNSLSDNKPKFWFLQLNDNKFFSEYLFEKVKSVIGMPVILERVYANGQTMGQHGSFHQDSKEPNTFTFLLYMNQIENIDEWGGETQYLIGNGKILSYLPVPNTGLFFSSNMLHRGMAPRENVLRVTIAWKMRIFS